jgi:large subunit ribosomal protein L7/L12
VLIAAGAKKVDVIKVVRAITGLGLKEAKDWSTARRSPSRKAARRPTPSAEEAAEEAGAKVEIK